jgi:spore maturation protein CgeB
MKILLVGAFSSDPSIYTYATSFQRTLISLGHNVITYNTRPTGIIRFAPKSYNDYTLVRMAQAFHPELLFLIKAENVTAQTLRLIKQQTRCKIINFYTDNPFTLWNHNSNATVLERLPELDCFLSWSPMLIESLRSAGCRHVCHFPFAYDEEIFSQPVVITDQEREKYTADVCFVGTWEPEREQWLSALHYHLPNVVLALWGNQWHEQCKDAHLRQCIRGTAIYHETLIKIFHSSKIVLNFIRAQNMTSHNMRTFEVPASSAFLLTQRTKGQACDYFKEEESIACFGNLEELINKVTLYMMHEEVRRHIAQQSHQRVQAFTLTQQLQRYFASCPVFLGTRIGTWNATLSNKNSLISK